MTHAIPSTVILTGRKPVVIPTERSEWRNLGSISALRTRKPTTGFLPFDFAQGRLLRGLASAPVGMTGKGEPDGGMTNPDES
ncbi:MAG: hypothetical protein F4Z31_10005 [Gemmatimonadetes bacterium]|nr:hypothetical protein [Gemmatimonadota bacterium]